MISKINKLIPIQDLLGGENFKRRMGRDAIKNGMSDFKSVDSRDDLTIDEKVHIRITNVGDIVAGGMMSSANPIGLLLGGGIILTNIGIRSAIEQGIHRKIKGAWKGSRAKAQAQQTEDTTAEVLGNPCLSNGQMMIQVVR